MKYQIVRYYNGTKGYGKIFDTIEEAREFLRTDKRVVEDKIAGFDFKIQESKMTNFESIKRMSEDEFINEFMYGACDCEKCAYEYTDSDCRGIPCRVGYKKWLESDKKKDGTIFD